jgi:actin-related protein
LPDGTSIEVWIYRLILSLYWIIFQLGTSRYRAPEILFNPELIGEECEGIHEILSGSIQRSDMDLRRTLYQNIVLSGGSTLFRGIFHYAIKPRISSFLLFKVLVIVYLVN